MKRDGKAKSGNRRIAKTEVGWGNRVGLGFMGQLVGNFFIFLKVRGSFIVRRRILTLRY